MAMAMDFSFLLILCIASIVPQAFANCGLPCTSPPKTGPITIPPVIGKPPVTIPPVIGKPPVTIPTLPPLPLIPPVVKPTLPPLPSIPPVVKPTLPPLPPVVKPTLPPVVKPTLPPLPPVVKPTLPPLPSLPPVVKPILPPITATPPSTKPGCPPPPGKAKTCPIDTVKLGACLDVLGVAGAHVGDPALKCCPLIKGLASVDAALCLCTTIKLKVLSDKMFLPIATQLFITCGKTLPPGYNCA